MKITIWIRPDSDGVATLRLDTKLESLDTPVIQRYGFKLAKAIEGTTDKGAPSAGAQSLKDRETQCVASTFSPRC